MFLFIRENERGNGEIFQVFQQQLNETTEKKKINEEKQKTKAAYFRVFNVFVYTFSHYSQYYFIFLSIRREKHSTCLNAFILILSTNTQQICYGKMFGRRRQRALSVHKSKCHRCGSQIKYKHINFLHRKMVFSD